MHVSRSSALSPARAGVVVIFFALACSRSSAPTPLDASPARAAVVDALPARQDSPRDECAGVVRGEPVVGLEQQGWHFRLIIEGQPVFPICDTCGVTIVVEPPGPHAPVASQQDRTTGTIFGLLREEPPAGACVRVSEMLGDFQGRPVGRYLRSTERR